MNRSINQQTLKIIKDLIELPIAINDITIKQQHVLVHQSKPKKLLDSKLINKTSSRNSSHSISPSNRWSHYRLQTL